MGLFSDREVEHFNRALQLLRRKLEQDFHREMLTEDQIERVIDLFIKGLRKTDKLKGVQAGDEFDFVKGELVPFGTEVNLELRIHPWLDEIKRIYEDWQKCFDDAVSIFLEKFAERLGFFIGLVEHYSFAVIYNTTASWEIMSQFGKSELHYEPLSNFFRSRILVWHDAVRPYLDQFNRQVEYTGQNTLTDARTAYNYFIEHLRRDGLLELIPT